MVKIILGILLSINLIAISSLPANAAPYPVKKNVPYTRSNVKKEAGQLKNYIKQNSPLMRDYYNNRLGFSLKIPPGWKNKYESLTESENYVYYSVFRHIGINRRAAKLGYNAYAQRNEGALFKIGVCYSPEIPKYLRSGRYIGTNNGKYYFFLTPNNQAKYGNRAQQQEYRKMRKSLNFIFDSIVLE